MRKIFVLGLMLLFIVGSFTAAYAATADEPKKDAVSTYRLEIGNKVERGSKNILFGWTELPKKIVDITKESKNPFWGLLAGTYQGTLKAMARTVSGISDVVTAPITPDKGPMIQDDINVE
ncbi:MAG: hypothetical protein A2Z72_05255 [Omnitrophica bacterium RBG_13_46_9]|nr:MAG: hypothetical protein A2Z72_05255 [Omnitrophica bacterium RBG_13_46_9]